jgi:ankyrin repeat protein
MDNKDSIPFNATISMKPIESLGDINNKDFNLCFYVYQGKLTSIIEVFNHQPIEKSIKIVKESVADKNRTPLQIAAFLNYSNIFVYLLTFEADSGKIDEDKQSTWHILGYRGHTRIMGLLLNHIRYVLKQKSLKKIDSIKKEYGFSSLDIVKGKLSKAVYLTEVNIQKFQELQKKVKKEAERLIKEFIDKLTMYLGAKDINGQTPLHLAAMSKFSLSHEIINQILDFNFFQLDESWEDYLSIFSEIQALEIKKERMNQDPRRCQRIERELITLLGEDAIKNQLTEFFKNEKRQMLKGLINIKDNNGDNLLHICSFFGNYKIINRLINYGGNKRIENKDDKKPVDIAKDNKVRKNLTNLNEAAKASNEKDIQELVNFGKDINEKLSIFSFAPIHKIIESKKKNKHEVLKKMLLLGSDPNIKDSNGWTALHYACQYGDFESLKILIDTKANINAFSNNQRTPLHLAAKMNRIEIVKYLTDKILSQKGGMNTKFLNAKDDHGCTPSHLAAKEGNKECLEILLTKGADLYAVDLCGWNILHYASFHARKDTIRFICKYDADYDKLQNTKNTQNKLPIEILSNYNLKPYFMSLWHAAREGDLDMTKRLIVNENQNPNEQTYFEKNTPLHLAVLNNHYLEVRLLLEYKANKTIKNKYGILPYEYATLMTKPIQLIYKESKDIDRDTFDLRKIIQNLINKPSDIVNATVCKKNHNLRVWTANDFNEKINKELRD